MKDQPKPDQPGPSSMHHRPESRLAQSQAHFSEYLEDLAQLCLKLLFLYNHFYSKRLKWRILDFWGPSATRDHMQSVSRKTSGLSTITVQESFPSMHHRPESRLAQSRAHFQKKPQTSTSRRHRHIHPWRVPTQKGGWCPILKWMILGGAEHRHLRLSQLRLAVADWLSYSGGSAVRSFGVFHVSLLLCPLVFFFLISESRFTILGVGETRNFNRESGALSVFFDASLDGP